MKSRSVGYNSVTAFPKKMGGPSPRNGKLDMPSTATVKPLVYSVQQAATALNVSTGTVWRMVYAREIRASKVRNRVMIRISDIEEFLTRNQLRDYGD